MTKQGLKLEKNQYINMIRYVLENLKMVDKVGSVLVIGGGIAGMRSSLDLSSSGFKVYLVESSPVLGGEITQLDCLTCKVCHRYFPQSENYEKMTCGVCYLPTILDDVRWNSNIDVLTRSHINAIEKKDENFVVSISRNIGYTDNEKRNSQGSDLDKTEIETTIHEDRELIVGAIILSAGFEEFDARKKSEFGYGLYKNVVTSIEFERLVSASGPTNGEVIRPSDGRKPQKIAFIQCVGSRDEQLGNPYCSSVCCTYAMKEAVMAKEHDNSIQITIFHMDIRTFGKGDEEYYNRAQEEHDVKFTWCRVASVEEVPETKNLLVKYVESGEIKTDEFDIVVLSTGFRPGKNVEDLANMMGIELNQFNFCETGVFSPVETNIPGIYVGGAISAPKDVSDTIAQASAAAAKASSMIASERGKEITVKEYPPERQVAGKEPRIGVFIDSSDAYADEVVDLQALSEYVTILPDVVYVEKNPIICNEHSQNRIKEMIEEHDLNRIVIAAGSPRTTEPFFRNTLREAGLNPYLFQIANIREQCAWVHRDEPEKAVAKAKDLLRMAVARARLLEPLPKLFLKVNQSALIIGGGLSGMTAALEMARQGFEAYLVEREAKLGGNLRNLHYIISQKNEDPQQKLGELIEQVENNPKIHVFKGSTLKKIEGRIGAFKSTLSNDSEIEHGVVIVATGGREYKPTEYLYGQNPNVLTQMELEEKLGKEELKPNSVVMIQCVGCRNKERPYCSRVCCAHAVKNALKIKERNRDANVYVLYKDIRTYGLRELAYREAAKKGVRFIRYDDENPPVVTEEGGHLTVSVKDPVIGEEVILNPEILVLSTATLPQADNAVLAELLNVPLNTNKFFLEVHTRLKPMEFVTNGIFMCGMAYSPMFVDESISQACGAAAKATAILWNGEMELEPIISEVIDLNCDGCAYCIDPCPYNALTLIDYMRNGQIKKTVERNETACKGCGVCMATCPKKGIAVRGFSLKQLSAVADSALEQSHMEGREEFEPLILAFCCNWCSYTGADLAGITSLQYPSNIRIIRVMCSGMVHPNLVIDALLGGADGVMICGCHPGDCYYLEGNFKAIDRAEAISLLLEDFGLEPERFRLEWISATEAPKFAATMGEFTEQLKTLGPSPYKTY